MPPLSPRSGKRKIQDLATSEAASHSNDNTICKKICAEELSRDPASDKDKENDAPMPSVDQMPLDKSHKEASTVVGRAAMIGAVHNSSKDDESAVKLSVAARAALFENAICQSGGRGTLPVKRPVTRPHLKQSFSSFNMGLASSTKTNGFPRSAAAKLSTSSAEETNSAVTPPPSGSKGKGATRPGTPKKPELPALAIIKEPVCETPVSSSGTHVEKTGLTVTAQDGGTVFDSPATLAPGNGCEDGDDSVFEDTSLPLPMDEENVAPEESKSAEARVQSSSEDDSNKATVSSEATETAQEAVAAMEDSAQPQESGDASPLKTEVPIPASDRGEAECQNSGALHALHHGVEVLESTPIASSGITEISRRVHRNSSSSTGGKECLMSPEEAAVFDEIDDILNEAMDSECSDVSSCSVAQPAVQPSSTPPRAVEHQQPSHEPLAMPKADSPRTSTKEQPTGQLPRTISSFRKQQRDATPQHCPVVSTPSRMSHDLMHKDDEQLLSLDEKLKALQECVLTQQTVISQATQALNLCQASAEFLGSAEQVEGEKLLLIATQKRLACLNEIQRLKTEGHRSVAGLPKGSLVIKHIRFPINRDSMKDTGGLVYHFLCTVHYRGKVHASQLISSDAIQSKELSALEFDTKIVFSGMDEDFQVQIDIYGLKTVNPVVSHDKKYHIKKETIKMKLSSRGKKTDNIFLTPTISSPGGPNAVRTSSFQSLGSFCLTTSNCGQNTFALSKVPGSFCLEGKASVELSLHADHGLEHRGFLTLFEEVGGFGAWTRFWCLLKGSHLVLWRYPEEEEDKPPVDSIDLRQCITKEVSRLPRTECARAHTFELVIVEPLGARHRDTLTTTRHTTVAITKHRLSADSKEELTIWCTAINNVLSCIRKWDPEAYKAMNIKQFL
uniref:Putative actin binding protein anillin n=1 Tax=Amblyomma triste TaxID=251400 RepID=A0A023G5I4_AMBTT